MAAVEGSQRPGGRSNEEGEGEIGEGNEEEGVGGATAAQSRTHRGVIMSIRSRETIHDTVGLSVMVTGGGVIVALSMVETLGGEERDGRVMLVHGSWSGRSDDRWQNRSNPEWPDRVYVTANRGSIGASSAQQTVQEVVVRRDTEPPPSFDGTPDSYVRCRMLQLWSRSTDVREDRRGR
eukprot:157965-Amphidinium_carterae.1